MATIGELGVTNLYFGKLPNMFRMKRNTIVVLWFIIVLIGTLCLFLLYARNEFPRKDYEDMVVVTLKISISIGLIVGLIYKNVGSMLYGDAKNWDDLMNNLNPKIMGMWEWLFLVTYIIAGATVSTGGAAMLIGGYSRYFGL